jgi:hypothetical protein
MTKAAPRLMRAVLAGRSCLHWLARRRSAAGGGRADDVPEEHARNVTSVRVNVGETKVVLAAHVEGVVRPALIAGLSSIRGRSARKR